MEEDDISGGEDSDNSSADSDDGDEDMELAPQVRQIL